MIKKEKMTRSGERRKALAPVILCFQLLCVLTLCSGLMAGENFTPRDQDEARKWMEETLKHAGIKGIKIEDGNVTGQMANGPFVINLVLVSSMKQVTASGSNGVEWYQFPNVSVGPGHVFWRSKWVPAAIREGGRFEAALRFLVRKEQEDWEAKAAAKFEEFKPKAAAWRQQAIKPEMPEEAHRHQVLAENAFQSKDLGKAMAEYVAGLQVFPCWPEGHYNLAMLAGEIGSRPGYDIAVHHMKEYVELMPDAPDARAAKDSIIVWEDKR